MTKKTISPYFSLFTFHFSFIKVLFFLVVISTFSYADFTRENNVVYDNQTGLYWQDDSEAKDITKTWQEAIEYCENLTLESKDDWRLPNKTELLSIVDYSKVTPSINSIFENITSYYYWSSTTIVEDSDLAWGVVFYGGYTDYYYKSGSYPVRCVSGGQFEKFELQTVRLFSENYTDGTIVKESFTKSWTFDKDISNFKVKVISDSYGAGLSDSSFSKDGKTLKVTLSPDTSKVINKLVLKFTKDGNPVTISGSDTFWSITRTNNPPRLADGQTTQLVSSTSEPAFLTIDTFDADGDTVTLSIEDNAGGYVDFDPDNPKKIFASFSDGKTSHTIKVGLSDGKEKVIKEFTVLQFDSSTIESFYSDVDKNANNYIYDGIAFGTLKGVIWGQPDPNDNIKRIFRPTDDASLAETLAMILKASQKAGLIKLKSSDRYMPVYPSWAMPYYTYAVEVGAIDKKTLNLSTIYPTYEEVATMLVKILNLDEKANAVDLSQISFNDKDKFSNSLTLHDAKIVKYFGLFMNGDYSHADEKITRAQLAMVIEKIFMMPTATLSTQSDKVVYGDSFDMSLKNKKATSINSNYRLYDSSQDISATYKTLYKTLNTTANSENLTVGKNKIFAILNNNGVKNIISTNIEVVVHDKDNDGVQDKDDKWSDDNRYRYDENNNDIPDILDSIYGLSGKNASGTTMIDGQEVSIAKIIQDGGYTPSQTAEISISLAKGWSLISLNYDNLSNLPQDIKILWQYSGGDWKAYSNNSAIQTKLTKASLKSISSLNNSDGVWVLTDKAINLKAKENTNSAKQIPSQGWYLLGSGSETDMSKFSCGTGRNLILSWKYNSNSWKLYTPTANNLKLDSFDKVYPNEGFWVRCKD